MLVFHGSKILFDKFIAPCETGNIASKEISRCTGFSKIFLSESLETAQEYALKDTGSGYLYAVEIPESSYTLARCRKDGKDSKFQHTTYCVLPRDCEIVNRFAISKTRGEIAKVASV